jgi:hypothetical protein
MRRIAVLAAALALTAALATAVVPSSAAAQGSPGGARRAVMFVGDNWDGTATVVDARTHRPLHTVDTIPTGPSG